MWWPPPIRWVEEQFLSAKLARERQRLACRLLLEAGLASWRSDGGPG